MFWRVMASKSRTYKKRKYTPQTLQNQTSQNPPPKEKVFDSETTLDEAIKYVSGYNVVMKKLPEHLRNNKEVMMAALANNGRVLAQFTSEQRNDPEFVLAAIKQDWYAFSYASEELRLNKEFFLEEVFPMQPVAHELVMKDCYEDREFFEKVFERCPSAFMLAPQKFRQERDIALSAVSRDASIIREVSCKYREDLEFIIAGFQVCCEHFLSGGYLPIQVLVSEEKIVAMIMSCLGKSEEELRDPSCSIEFFTLDVAKRKKAEETFYDWMHILNIYEKNTKDEKYRLKYKSYQDFILECPYLPQTPPVAANYTHAQE